MVPGSITLILLLSFASTGSLRAQDEPYPQLDGYVTRVGTPEDFDVNGTHILCKPAMDKQTKNTLRENQSCLTHIYGEHLLVFGHLDKKSSTLYPTEIRSPAHPEDQSFSGVAVIDAILGAGKLRADGYAIQLTPSTHVTHQSPLAADAPPQPGQWIQYAGKRSANGAIQAASAIFFAPNVTTSEQKLRKKNEFDASAVSEDQRQSAVSTFFRGTDYKRIPAAHNDALQQRVTSLGERLIPAVQKQLEGGDPNKINFRFQIVESFWKDAMTMPNGIILVPEPLAKLLTDDQLAAVLADNIAAALEKQTYRSIPGNQARTAAVLGTTLIPIVGTATGISAAISQHNDLKHHEEQSGRDALVLMHDAGFDLQQAPLAWWRLSTSRRDFMQAGVPYRAAYLFQRLATDWAPGSMLTLTPDPVPATLP